MDKLYHSLVLIAIVTVSNTTKSVHYKSVMFYSPTPEEVTNTS
jgi:hypothetical protein